MASYEYDPYGNILSATGSMAQANPLRYRGYYYDRETGFYYLNSRYYDPKIGRFINADSYVATGQGILGYNMYAYCGNNPVNREDAATHAKITGYYNTTSLDFTGGLGVCDWLAGQSYEYQYEFGLDVLRKYGVIE